MSFVRPSSCPRITPLFAAAIIVLAWAPASDATASAQSQEQAGGDLRSMSLEELMSLEVTTVSKTSENLFRTPAAVYVITQEEIQRSGHRSIPELLRLAPGVEVAQVDANKWAITARGFNGRFANKLLVMIDGRTVYTPLFSGVFWDVQNVLPEDIERIEVIRGPGGTLWGANAVNGVINIITKTAGESRGWFAEAGVGTEERGFGSVRFGGSGQTVDYRAYARFFNRDEFVFANGADAADDWQVAHGGFRVDWAASDTDDVSISGELYTGDTGQTVVPNSTLLPVNIRADLSGGHLRSHWTRRYSGGSTSDLQVYYDRTRRVNFEPETRDTIDIDFQLVWPAHSRHEIVWGAGYRFTRSTDLEPAQFPDGGRSLNLYSAFVQDQIALNPDWSLIIGSKFEHNDFTGFEIQPSARFIWANAERYAVWGAVSRAVRTPSEGESDASILLSGGTDPGTGLPIVLSFQGNPDLEAEKLIAYEAGFRTQPTAWFSLDVASFYNDYSDLIEATPLTPMVQFVPPPPRIIQPIVGANVARADGYGVEINSRFQVHPRVQVGAVYSYFRLDMEGSPQLDQFDEAGASPRNQFKLKANIDLPHDIRTDAFLYFVDRLESLDVDSYARLDLRFAWRPTPRWELAVVGQSLLEAEHFEFVTSVLGEIPTQVQRAVYGMVQWRY